MAPNKPASPKEILFIGLLTAAAGLYFMLVGASVLPIPGGPKNLHAPLWVVFCAGLVFFLGGGAVLVQVFGKANANGELPADTPFWLHAAQRLVGVVIFGCFAMIGTWIALFGESGQFSGSFSGFSFGVTIARLMFGLGALICWAAMIGFAVSSVRKLAGVRKTS